MHWHDRSRAVTGAGDAAARTIARAFQLRSY
jgi:hypothetical protein